MTETLKGGASWTYQDVLVRFAADLAAVEKAVLGGIESRCDELSEIAAYVSRSGGKRLRPLLAIVCARLCGYRGGDHVLLGNVVEYLHAATLLHDDVLDGAALRRGAPSANHRWGNHLTVLGGDFLYTTAFDILLGGFSREIIRILCRSSMDMVEGEVLQRRWRGRPVITEETYLNIISLKTASLISACCRTGALLAGASPAEADALGEFGRRLGLAFQVIDDTLDYTADPERLGKALGGDLRQGTITLPLIRLLRDGVPDAEREDLLELLREEATPQKSLEWIVSLIKSSGTGSSSIDTAKGYAESSKELLEMFRGRELYPALIAAADYIIVRDY